MPKLFESSVPSRRRRWLSRLAAGYAWFFAVGSLLGLIMMLSMRVGSIATGDCAIFCWNTSDGVRHTGWLTDYSGQSGFLLAAIEAGVVFLALVGSCLRRDTIRHASLLVLLAWSALWLLGAARLMFAMPIWGTAAGALAAGLAVVACYIRARDRWSLFNANDDESPRRPRPLTA
jgi:hypothetical protein